LAEWSGCVPISSIWRKAIPPGSGSMLAVYGYDLAVPLVIGFSGLSKNDAMTMRWVSWISDGGYLSVTLHQEIDGFDYSDYGGTKDPIRMSSICKAVCNDTRETNSKLVAAYRRYVADVLELKVPDFTHGQFSFKVGTSRSEAKFDQYHLSVPNEAFKQLVSKVVVTDRSYSLQYLVETVLHDVDGLSVGNVSLKYRHDKGGFTYINGIRINRDDVSPCLAALTRFTDTASYNVHLKSISRISLKLQALLRSGTSLKMARHHTANRVNITELQLNSKLAEFDWGSVESLNTGYNAFMALSANGDTSRVVEIPIPIEKEYRKAAYFTFLGKKRKILSSLDTFCNFCRNTYSGNTMESYLAVGESTGSRPAEAASYASVDSAIAERIFKLDQLIDPADHIIPSEHMVKDVDKQYGKSQYRIASETEAWKFFSELPGILFEELKVNISERLRAVVQTLELLEKTVERYGITKHKNKNGLVDYFLVTGESGSIYKVNLAGGVFRYKMAYDSVVANHDEYICIDPAGGHGKSSDVGFNYTVSVMMALTNDSVVAPSIYTLADRLNRDRAQ